MTQRFLTEADLAAIEAAVRAAEARTKGEIYCVVAEQSSDYMLTPLAWAVGVALLAPALMLLAGLEIPVAEWARLGQWTSGQSADAGATARAALIGTLLLQGVLFAGAMLLVSFGPIRRMLTPRGYKRDRVRQRAEEQFLARNLHTTRERTGVLIYLSRAERMAELVADAGIDAKVGAEVWTRAMSVLVAGLRDGDPARGFTAAITLCGEVLAEHFPPRADNNPDELSNSVVFLSSP